VIFNKSYSGITKEILENVTKTLAQVQADLKAYFDKDTILLGHSLDNDLHSMKIIHSRIIDTSVLFQTRKGAKLPLKGLAYQHLKYTIQNVDLF
jgi:RNA exonuclease 1